jgi:hypothetical protein
MLNMAFTGLLDYAGFFLKIIFFISRKKLHNSLISIHPERGKFWIELSAVSDQLPANSLV